MPEASPRMSATRLKSFVRHLAKATKVMEQKRAAQEEIENHISRLKETIDQKNSRRADISDATEDLHKLLKKVLTNENKMISAQAVETSTVQELKEQVSMLTKKLVTLGREYADSLSEKNSRIQELESELSNTKSYLYEHKLSEDSRRKRLEEVESKIDAHHERTREEHLKSMELRLKELEKAHKALEKSGDYKKSELNHIKKLIESHKGTISGLKKKQNSQN